MWNFFSQAGSLIASFMFLYALFEKYFPNHLRFHIDTHLHKFARLFSFYAHITFHQHTNDRFSRSKAYVAVETYVGAISRKTAERLRAEAVKLKRPLTFSIDECEEITDVFEGIKVWWVFKKIPQSAQTISFGPEEVEKRYYQLTFLKKDRDFVFNSYLGHVMEKGREIGKEMRQRKLYTNTPREGDGGLWRSVPFEHPASFDKLAMDPLKKQGIIDDLKKFSNAKDYYKSIGKAWKRGYLLYGPPGTGKSTLIAAMANLLQYDVYDLELTAVANNTELRRLLIETRKRSVIVIEDIDCSLNLAGKRKNETEKTEAKNTVAEKIQDLMNDDSKSRVTLSGLLNFIDGLWSVCGGERVVVFTTNHVEKLDPALIRRGRMDMRIELSYCCFEAFKLLAKNYLGIESHHLFPEIKDLLQECEITPADVAEYLISKSGDEDRCLMSLMKACERQKLNGNRVEIDEDMMEVRSEKETTESY